MSKLRQRLNNSIEASKIEIDNENIQENIRLIKNNWMLVLLHWKIWCIIEYLLLKVF
jgi:flagellar motor switch protein FliM